MMNLPNFEISQVYKSFVAWVAAGSTGLALILNVRTTQLAVAPAWPQDFTVMLDPFATAAPDAPMLATCWFDKTKCRDGIEALRMYRREYDHKRQELKVHPLHDWTSHYADAFRYFAVGHRERAPARSLKRDVRWVV